MRIHFLLLPLMAIFITACASSNRFSTPQASGHYGRRAMQCVPYARSASGIQLYGDAHTWWDQASTSYIRDNRPRPGAVLVLAKTSRMTHGHLAVVKRIINDREIDVTHTNWGSNRKTRSIVYDFVRVQDVSTYNDWSLVRFWNHEAGVFGFPYGAKGFIHKSL